jgi:flagellar motility protein MotE (MotC chaperone)
MKTAQKAIRHSKAVGKKKSVLSELKQRIDSLERRLSRECERIEACRIAIERAGLMPYMPTAARPMKAKLVKIVEEMRTGFPSSPGRHRERP